MPTIEDLLKEVEQQEKSLQFEDFTSETALEIGMSLIERAKKESLAIAIDIRRNGHQLFHYSFQGTSPDNDQWIINKIHVVNRLNISSYRFRLTLNKDGLTPADRQLNPAEYAAAGGSFPVIVKNVGVVGTITISGLADKDDHAMVVWAIEKYLSK